MTTETTKRNKMNILIACIFCGLLFVLLILYFLIPDSDFSGKEKRVLSEFPKATAQAVFSGEYSKKIESYLQDQMPFRNLFVAISSYFNHFSGQNGTDGVYVSKNGYLINTPVKEDNRNLSTNLKFLNSFAEKSGIPAYLMIVPETGYIHEDLLPKGHEPYMDDAIFDTIRGKTKDNFTFVDLRSLFSNEKDAQIYYKTDHHWTADGAMIAANAFLKLAGKPLISKADFYVESIKGFGGTTYSKSALWLKPTDTMELWHSNKAALHVEVSDLGKPDKKVREDVFFKEHLTKDDRYPVYLDGNHSLTHITNDSVQDGVLLLLKDSFGNTLATQLLERYHEIWMVDLRYYRTSAVSDLLAENNVDTILVNYSVDNIVNDTNILWLK